MRTIGLQDLRLAFERTGAVLPAAPPAAPPAPLPAPPPPDPADDIPAELLVDHPDTPRCQWISPWLRDPVVRIDWDYNPWSKERLP